jgi:hypothetical protein
MPTRSRRAGAEGVRWCPECGASYEDAVAACPRCRVVLTNEPPAPEEDFAPEVVHLVPDAAAAALLCGMLEHHGISAVLRSGTLPGYGTVRRDWTTTAWGEILVPHREVDEARALITDYLAALELGGVVRDEDVEGVEPG